jgi:hypothetical protein
MNLLTRFIILGALLLAPVLRAADSFEGRITMTMTPSNGKIMTINQTIKGHVLRIDTAGMEGGVIMDMDARTMTILLMKQKAYMVRPMPTAEDVRSKAAEAGRTEHDTDVEDTGKTDTILGYKCHQFLVKDGDKVTELWIAPALGTFAGLGQQGGGNPFGRSRSSETAAKWERVFKGKAGYPMRVITHDASGAQTFKLEVTNVQKGGIMDADVAPPPDFKPFQMPNIPGMNFGG